MTSSDVTADVVLSDFTEQQIAKGGWGGVGGNPFLLWQASTSAGVLEAEPTYLGRSVEAPMSVEASFALPVLAELEVSGLCDNRGSHLTLSGALTASGVSGTPFLQNSLQPGRDNRHQDSVGAQLLLELTPEGGQTSFRKGQGGPGGSPHIFTTLDGGQTLH